MVSIVWIPVTAAVQLGDSKLIFGESISIPNNKLLVSMLDGNRLVLDSSRVAECILVLNALCRILEIVVQETIRTLAAQSCLESPA